MRVKSFAARKEFNLIDIKYHVIFLLKIYFRLAKKILP